MYWTKAGQEHGLESEMTENGNGLKRKNAGNRLGRRTGFLIIKKFRNYQCWFWHGLVRFWHCARD